MVKESPPKGITKPLTVLDMKEDDDHIVMQKGEVIDILKTLEGLNRKLQPLLKT